MVALLSPPRHDAIYFAPLCVPHPSIQIVDGGAKALAEEVKASFTLQGLSRNCVSLCCDFVARLRSLFLETPKCIGSFATLKPFLLINITNTLTVKNISPAI